jgi:hypothetical protein
MAHLRMLACFAHPDDEAFTASFAPAQHHDRHPWPEIPPAQLRESFALAQHHKIPTRLLDWTLSPYIAAFFAAKEVWEGKVNPEEIAVWAINRKDGCRSPICMVTVSYSRNPFLRAQSSLFTFDTDANTFFEKNGKWPTQEARILKNWTDREEGSPIRKVTAPKECVEEILRSLYLHNVSPAHLMPTLDNVTRTYRFYQRLFNREASVEYRSGILRFFGPRDLSLPHTEE